MNNELAKFNNIQLTSLDDAFRIGSLLAESGFFKDSKDKTQAVAKILAGNELGIPPVSALQGIIVVEGKLSLSASLCGSLVKKSGKYNYKVRSHDEKHCSIDFYELWGESWEVVGNSLFTIDDAKQAGLANKQNWQKYPKAMLFARAMTQGSRWFCPDIFSGSVYSPEELNPNIPVTEDGEVIDVPAMQPSKAIFHSDKTREEILLGKETTSLIEAIAFERGMEVKELTGELREWTDSQGLPRTRAEMNEGQLQLLKEHLKGLLNAVVEANESAAEVISTIDQCSGPKSAHQERESEPFSI